MFIIIKYKHNFLNIILIFSGPGRAILAGQLMGRPTGQFDGPGRAAGRVLLARHGPYFFKWAGPARLLQ